jgi:hypothetical protein
MSGQMDRQAIHAEMELARGTFQTLCGPRSGPPRQRAS